MELNSAPNYTIAKIRNFIYCGIRRIIGHRHFCRRYYYGNKILNIDDANVVIAEAIKCGRPFLAARFGDAELKALVHTLEIERGERLAFSERMQRIMHMNAGFFPPTDENLRRFGNILYNAAKSVDIWGVWFNYLEDYIIQQATPKSRLVQLEGLEPYRAENPWSEYLRGKRVLVVHPFEESIKAQYERHEKLFRDKRILPEFELITYKAVQSNAGAECPYSNWFEALDSMFDDIKNIEFDIAIVGCGSYGLPLASRIKSLNKQVIHLAGATQILFGIRGARWDVRPEMQHYFNEYWIRPNKNERPQNASNVEGACYW